LLEPIKRMIPPGLALPMFTGISIWSETARHLAFLR
jgi:hypothetical protein